MIASQNLNVNIFVFENILIDEKDETVTAIYTYNHENRRERKVVTTTKRDETVVSTNHIWDGDEIVAEKISSVDSANASVVSYLHGIGLISSKSYATAETSVYLYNAHGDVVQLVKGLGGTLGEGQLQNEGGTTSFVIARYDYDAYGIAQNPDLEDKNDTNPYRYAGEYQDLESGYIYLRARYYDQKLGRFINQDPIKDGNNWHAYGGGNPVMFSDPSGLRLDDAKYDYKKKKWNYESDHNPSNDARNQKREQLGQPPIKEKNSENFYEDVPDITMQINGQNTEEDFLAMRKHYETMSMLNLLNLLNIFAYALGVSMIQAEKLLWFREQVNHKAAWDIKYAENWEGQFPTVPFPKAGEYFMYEGFKMDAADLGNYLYGKHAAALGLSEQVAQIGGGYAHSGVSLQLLTPPNFGDLPEDTEMVLAGYDKFFDYYPKYSKIIYVY